MPPILSWNEVNKILDSIDWSEFFDIIDGKLIDQNTEIPLTDITNDIFS